LFNPWLALNFKIMQLGFEAQSVVALRMMRIAGGGVRGQTEARRMVAEKIAAVTEAQTTAVSAIMKGSKDTVVGSKVLRVLNKRVRANKRRLSRR
jgi:hypothetical protein